MTDDRTVTPSTGLANALESGRFAITAELTPPVSVEADALAERARGLRGLVDAVNVTDGPNARAHVSALAAAAILVREGVEPVLQLTCRDRNRIALQGDLLGAAALGIRNLLILRGDDPAKGDQPDAMPVFDIDTRALIRTAADIAGKGVLPSGRTVSGRADFLIGAADMPVDPPPGWTPEALAAKMAAGARFAQTQFCMDAGVVRRYVARLAEHGIVPDLKLLVGVVPPVSVRSALWIRDNLFGAIVPDALVARLEAAADPRAEGRRICAGMLQELASIDGVAGAHIMAPMNEAAIAGVIAESGLGPAA